MSNHQQTVATLNFTHLIAVDHDLERIKKTQQELRDVEQQLLSLKARREELETEIKDFEIQDEEH